MVMGEERIMTAGDIINITSPMAFVIARNLDVEGYMGIGTVLLVFIMVFFALSRTNVVTAFFAAALSSIFIAIPLRFLCAQEYCLLSDTHLVMIVVFGSLMAIGVVIFNKK